MVIVTPGEEAQRLAALHRQGILDTPPEAAFDRLTALAAHLLDAPVALLSFLDRDRQWCKSRHGDFPPQWKREVSLCAHTILQDAPLILEDARQDARFDDSPLLDGPQAIRFYVGAPVCTPDGFRVGTLCVFDHQPRHLSTNERERIAATLSDLAAVAAQTLELRRAALEATTDSSERRRAEEALRESQAQKQAVLGVDAECFVDIDRQGRIVEWNASAHEMFGHDASAQGESLIELIVPRHWHRRYARSLEMCFEASENGDGPNPDVGRRVKMLALNPHGEEFRVEVALARLSKTGPDGGTIYKAYIRDVDRRERADEWLRQLEMVVTNANDAILITEAEPFEHPGPRILYVNDAFTRMTGFSRDEIIGKTPRMLHGKSTDPEARAKISQALHKWKPVVVEIINYRKDGTPFWVELSIVPVTDETGWFTHWVSVQRDISDRKRVEEVLRDAKIQADHAKEEAERANLAKSEFLSRMSHELRTPLNAILGFAQLLEMEDLDESEDESVRHILKAGHHLLGLINEVLDIARIESGKLAMSSEPVSVEEAVDEALALVRPLASRAQVTLPPGIAGASGTWVLADRQRLKQVLLNLLSNAVKYNVEGGAIIVRAEAEAGHIRLSVRDTGRGIAPGQLGALFTPFERLGAEKSSIEGTGLGLALSKRLIEAMDGTLHVESESGRGSTFTIDLPAVADPMQRPDLPPEPAAPHVVGEARQTVLYIEDNLSNLSLVRRILSSRPEIELVAAMQGGLGLDLAREHRPDLILLDLHLPDMDGEDVLRRLRQDDVTRHIPVIVITADATPGRRERLLDEGVAGCLTKPIEVRGFLDALDGALSNELAVA